MRTMPSATEVTVPSLRASAASLTLSMRLLMRSLISDGLSVVVAIFVSLEVGRCVRFTASIAFRDSGFGTGDSEERALLPRIPNPESRVPASSCQRRLQARELAAQRAVDDDVAGIDHRAADQGLVHRRFQLDLAAEALAQRGPDAVELGFRQRHGRGDLRAHDAFGIRAQLLEQP